MGHKPLRGTRSTPPPSSEKPGGGLGQITEDQEEDKTGSDAHGGSLKVPLSPTRSLSTSPQMGKKRRVAQSRRTRSKRSSTEPDMDGAGEGVATEGVENVSTLLSCGC